MQLRGVLIMEDEEPEGQCPEQEQDHHRNRYSERVTAAASIDL